MDNIQYQKNIWEAYQGDQHGIKLGKVIHFLAGRYIKDNILDVGAGDGALMFALKNKGYKQIKGIDLVPQSEFVEQGDISKLPYGDASFDTTFCTEVIEHLDIDQINKGLPEIYRVLKSGRYLILTVPYKEDFRHNQIICPNCKHEFHRVGHLQYFDKKSIKDLLESHGFKIISSKPYSFGPMAAHPLFKYFNFIYKRYSHLQALTQTLVTIAKK